MKTRPSTQRGNHWNWKGGRKRNAKGYVLVLMPEHPNADSKGYIYEHRLIMENILGRYLTIEERVHHNNRIKDDNEPSNLRLFPSESDHEKFEHSCGNKHSNRGKHYNVGEDNPNWRGENPE